jgi:hypothetical protein
VTIEWTIAVLTPTVDLQGKGGGGGGGGGGGAHNGTMDGRCIHKSPPANGSSIMVKPTWAHLLKVDVYIGPIREDCRMTQMGPARDGATNDIQVEWAHSWWESCRARPLHGPMLCHY